MVIYAFRRRLLLGCALYLGLFAPATAGEISGTLTFEKKPPTVGLVYMADDHGLSKSDGPKLDQKDQAFLQPMVVAPVGAKIKFVNSDNTDHNVYATDADAGADFDIGLASPGSQIDQEVTWQDGAVIKVGCKIHPKMRAYVAAVDSRYHQIIEFDRTQNAHNFRLEAPDSLSVFRLWLPNYDPVEIQLEAGKEATAELIKKGKVYGSIKLKRS